MLLHMFSGLPVNRASPSASSFPLGAAAQVKGRDEVKRALVLMLQSIGMVSDGTGVLDWQTLSGNKLLVVISERCGLC